MFSIAGTARFISDLHLREERPDLTQRFAAFLADTAASNVEVLFILGAKQAMALVEKLPDFDAVFVDADNHVIMSSGLKDRIKVIAEPTPGV